MRENPGAAAAGRAGGTGRRQDGAAGQAAGGPCGACPGSRTRAGARVSRGAVTRAWKASSKATSGPRQDGRSGEPVIWQARQSGSCGPVPRSSAQKSTSVAPLARAKARASSCGAGARCANPVATSATASARTIVSRRRPVTRGFNMRTGLPQTSRPVNSAVPPAASRSSARQPAFQAVRPADWCAARPDRCCGWGADRAARSAPHRPRLSRPPLPSPGSA